MVRVLTILIPLMLLLDSAYARYGDSIDLNIGHHCKYWKDIKETKTEQCCNGLELFGKQYTLDKVPPLSEDRLRASLYDCSINANCTFYKITRQEIDDCCEGWKGPSCTEAVCYPECLNNGTCIDPPTRCSCKPGWKGATCGETTKDEDGNINTRYCYENDRCSGSFINSSQTMDSKGGREVSYAECCQTRSGRSWGREGEFCNGCINEDDVVPKYDFCVSHGKGHFQSFHQFDFMLPDTDCWYMMAQITDALEIEAKQQNCRKGDDYPLCRKIVRIKTDGLLIELNGGDLWLGGDDLQDLSEYHTKELAPLISATRQGSSIVVNLYGNDITVKADDRTTVTILMTKGKYLDKIFGLCNMKDQSSKGIQPFVEAAEYRVIGFSDECSAVDPTTPSCTTSELEIGAMKTCSFLYDMYGSFMAYIETMYNWCWNEMCVAKDKNGADAVLCDITMASSLIHNLNGGRGTSKIDLGELCHEECPPNQVYTTMKSKCPRTCFNIYKEYNAEICEAGTTAGCECGTGYALFEKECIPIEECPCESGGNIYQHNQKFKRGCNSCQCLLGRPDCTTNDCPETCVLAGSHITTFDGRAYEVEVGDRECKYKMFSAAFTVSQLAEIPTVYITFKQCLDMPDARCISKVTINYAGTEIVISRNKEITRNGSRVKTPIHVAGLQLKMFNKVIIVQGTGLYLWYDFFERVHIEASPDYQKKVWGLCGWYNGDTQDDFGAHFSAQDFVYDMGDAVCRQHVTPIDHCAYQEELKNYAERTCSHLKKADFRLSCRDYLPGKDYYYDMCVKDTCRAGRKYSKDWQCVYTKALAAYCVSMESEWMVDWDYSPETKYCFKEYTSCDGSYGTTYQQCGSRCSGTCRDLALPDMVCEDACVEGCYCQSDHFLDDNNICVPKQNCTCYNRDENKVYRAGQKYMIGCKECICKDGRLECNVIDDCDQELICPPDMEFRQDFRCPFDCDHPRNDKCFQSLAYKGCFCKNENLVISRNKSSCIPADECPCYLHETYYQPGETIVTVDCKMMRCERAKWVFVKNTECFYTCVIGGDVHVTTFDGLTYSFEGTCEYNLVQTEGFAVAASAYPCGHTGKSCTKFWRIWLHNTEIFVIKGGGLIIDSISYPLDTAYFEHGLSVVVAGDTMVQVYSQSLGIIVRISFDSRGYISLRQSIHRGQDVYGLCGNFDGSSNDFLLNQMHVSMSEFVNQHKHDTQCSDVSYNSNDTCQDHREKWARESCGMIKHGYKFAECIKYLGPAVDRFYEECVYDSCKCDTGGDCECLCDALAKFAEECASFGFVVRWRTQHLCPMQCEDGKQYMPCGSPCLETCDNVNNLPEDCCMLPCEEGCFCPEGRVFHENKCIPVEKCRCIVDGTEYKPGHTYTIDDCKECTCESGQLNCNETNCPCDDFRCSNGNCIDLTKVCDGTLDCDNDEDDCGCNYGNWSDWSPCSTSCGPGIKKIRRTNKGSGCDVYNETETESCNLVDCPPICPDPEGDGPGYHLNEIISSCACEVCICTSEGEVCMAKQNTTVDGGVSNWSPWSECSKKCEGGVQHRYRLCNNPLPQCYGDSCDELLLETRDCNNNISCCELGDYTPWSVCDTPCGEGIKTRTRNPQSHRSECQGIQNTEEGQCFGDNCPECVVSPWSIWSPCSTSCGAGTRTQDRTVEGNDPICDGIATEKVEECSSPPCECVEPFEWQKNSLCYQKTCEDMTIPDDCGNTYLPQCVCPKDMYLKNGECVSFAECYKCSTEDGVKKHGESWYRPDDICSTCHCEMGEVHCESIMDIPTCQDDEELSYKNGPCCPECVHSPDKCSKKTVVGRMNHTLSNELSCVSETIEYHACKGHCGISKSSPLLVVSDDDYRNEVTDCKCCTPILADSEPKDVLLTCTDGNTMSASLYTVVDCTCDACQGYLP